MSTELGAVAIQCSQSPSLDWDDFVLTHPDASVFHTSSAVSIGSKAFGLRTFFLTARSEDGALLGALPLVEQVIVPWTRCLVSLPFCTYGGPLASDVAVLKALLDGAETLAGERGADQIVLRNARAMTAIPYPVSLDKISMVLPLPDNVDELSKRLGSKLRSQIRRADREKPEVRVGHSELLGDFYAVFCSVMRDLGTPVYPLRFFNAVLDAIGGRASVVVLYLGGRPVSGAILVQWRDSLEVPWAATLQAANPMAINMRLYWELLQIAVQRRCTSFDFGRCSRDAGTYRFKAQWGAQPVQLHWQASGLGGKASATSDPRSKLEAARRVWRRLPLPFVNWLGPHISARLPW